MESNVCDVDAESSAWQRRHRTKHAVRTHIYISRRKRSKKEKTLGSWKRDQEAIALMQSQAQKILKRGKTGENEKGVAVEKEEKGSRCYREKEGATTIGMWGESSSLWSWV